MHPYTTLAAGLGLLATLSVTTGCVEPMSCTLMHAPNVIGVEFSQPLTTSGAYALTTTRDGVEDTCELILVDSTDPNDCVDGVCETMLRPMGSGSGSCPWETDWNTDDGGRLPGLTLVHPGFVAPDQFGVKLERAGELVATGTYTLDNKTDEPNGPGCGERTTNNVALTIDVP